MNTLEKRLLKMETEQKSAPMTKDESERCLDEHLAEEGMTRQQAISKYGSLSAYAYAVMCAPMKDSRSEPNDGRAHAERYMAMLDG